MATRDHIAVGQVALNTSTGDQDLTVTSLGWTPVAILVFITRNTSAGTLVDHSSWTVAGADDSDNDAYSYYADKDAVAATVTKRLSSHAPLNIEHFTYTSGVDLKFRINSGHATAGPISDGWRINITDAPAAAYLCTYVLFGGTGLSADLQGFTPGTTIGSTGTATTGFETSFGIVVCTGGPGDEGTPAAHMINSFGVFSSTANQAQIMTSAPNSLSTTSNHQRVETDSVCGQLHNGTLTWTAEVTSITSTTVVFTTRDGSTAFDKAWMLAIELPAGQDANVEVLNSPTTAASDWVHTGVGFQPDFSMLLTSMLQSIDTTVSANDVYSTGVGVLDGPDGFFAGTQGEDAVSTTDTSSIHSAQWIDHHDDTGTLAFDMDPTSSPFTSDGWTIDAADIAAANGTTRKWIALSVGETAAAGARPQGPLGHPLHGALAGPIGP